MPPSAFRQHSVRCTAGRDHESLPLSLYKPPIAVSIPSVARDFRPPPSLSLSLSVFSPASVHVSFSPEKMAFFFDSFLLRRSFHRHRHCRPFSSVCRAIILPRFGGPDVLELRNAEKLPDLSSHEILLATKSVSVNPLDVRVSSISMLILSAFCFSDQSCSEIS